METIYYPLPWKRAERPYGVVVEDANGSVVFSTDSTGPGAEEVVATVLQSVNTVSWDGEPYNHVRSIKHAS